MGIYRECITYLLKISTPSSFHKKVKMLGGSTNLASNKTKELRLLLKRSSYVVQNYRAFVYGLVHDNSMHNYLVLKRKLGITDYDSKNAFNIVKNSQDLKAALSDIHIRTVTDIEYMNRRFTSMVKQLNVYVKNAVYKKLYFVSKSFNIDIPDLVSEVFLKLVESYYWSMPSNKTSLYILNYLKRSALNHINVMISYYTANKRARLVSSNEDNSEFNLIVVSENQNSSENEMTVDDYLTENLFGSDFEQTHSIKSIIARYKYSLKTSLFIKLIMGEKNDIFTKWLRSNKYIPRVQTNETLMEYVGSNRSVELISMFMGLNISKSNRFLQTLKKHMIG